MNSYAALRSMQSRAIVPKAEGIACSRRTEAEACTKDGMKKAGPLAMRSPASASLE